MLKYIDSFLDSFTGVDYVFMVAVVLLAVLDVVMLTVHYKPLEGSTVGEAPAEGDDGSAVESADSSTEGRVE